MQISVGSVAANSLQSNWWGSIAWTYAVDSAVYSVCRTVRS